ncbi:uncharacterized protein [Anoplolepis gracilipes]|uniref:uncharacterized protein n=1 Tax=Anoplolepis gracilipes TaxID=354296 RepID=UPI003B9FFF77
MNVILLLTVLSLAMPIFGEETQAKKQDKRGAVGLSHGGFRDSGLYGNSVGADYGQGYLGAPLGHGVSAPAYSHNYNTPLYSSHRLDYSRGLGYNYNLAHSYGNYGGYLPGYNSAGVGYPGTRLGYGATGLGYDGAGLGYNTAKFGYSTAGVGYNAAGFGYGARTLGHGTGFNTGYRHGW